MKRSLHFTNTLQLLHQTFCTVDEEPEAGAAAWGPGPEPLAAGAGGGPAGRAAGPGGGGGGGGGPPNIMASKLASARRTETIKNRHKNVSELLEIIPFARTLNHVESL